MSNQPPNRARRGLFGDVVRQVAKFAAEVNRFGEEVRDALQAPSPTQERLEDVQSDLTTVQAELTQLQTVVPEIKDEGKREQELLLAVMQRFVRLEELIEKNLQADCLAEQRTLWEAAKHHLHDLLLLLLGATGAGLYEALIGDQLYPWLKESWSRLVGTVQSAGQPTSPLSFPDSPLAPPESPLSTSSATRGKHWPKPRIDFDWVTIPAGEFLMGSDKATDPLAYNDELPQHKVYLPDYRIARVPVTNAQYRMFVDATGHRVPSHWQSGQIPQGKERHPVVSVSWHDAIAFCDWAGVRLPSEAEWEKAARGTDGRIYPWGNQPPDSTLCNFNNLQKGTTAVGSYPQGASPYGCLDMAGNVWEWCSTQWLSTYIDYQRRVSNDLQGDENRLLRGGSWGNHDQNVRCAFRNYCDPGSRYGNIGFRVVSPGSVALHSGNSEL